MKFFSSDKIRLADAYTIANEPIPSIELMERAANRLKEEIISRYNPSVSFKIFAGPGNNGGDAWALGRLLWTAGYKNISVFPLELSFKIQMSSLAAPKDLVPPAST